MKKNRRKYLLLLILLLVPLLVSCNKDQGKGNDQEITKTEGDSKNSTMNKEKPVVAVSIVPEEAFVKAVAGDLVEVVTMIPAGASPANYQPSPKEMSAFENSSIYFGIGVPAEKANIVPNILAKNKDIKFVELDKIVEKVYPARFFAEGEGHDHDHDDHHEDADDHHEDADDHDHDDHHEDADDHDHDDHHEDADDHHEDADDHHDHKVGDKDPHVWMSPKRVVVMVETIRDELSIIDPENKETYSDNASKFIEQLNKLDLEIRESVSRIENKTFIIMHPSMGYFADDYGLKMISLEQHGKEATAKHFERVIEEAKEHDIKVVFYQAEFDNKQAKLLADEIKGEVVEIAPLSPDYLENLKVITEAFAKDYQ